uniref:Uncharacterized protein n=1 Tax=Oryza brachyantha TaxID=4533 RepID=J3M4C5_ORYBR
MVNTEYYIYLRVMKILLSFQENILPSNLFLFLQIIIKFASITYISVSSSIALQLAIAVSQCAVCPCEKMKVCPCEKMKLALVHGLTTVTRPWDWDGKGKECSIRSSGTEL